MNPDDRLVYRCHIVDELNNRNDLRVVANSRGLLSIYLTGTARALSYAGLVEHKLPASVAEGGDTNAAIAARVRAAIANPTYYRTTYEWVEPEQGAL